MYLRRSYLVHFFWPPGDRSWFWPGGHLPEEVVVGLPLPLPSSSAANDVPAVTVSATTNMAATVSIKMMRFMRYLLSLPHPPNGVPLKRCRVGCEFAGLGALCVPLPLATNKRPAPCPYTSTSLVLSSPHPLLPLLAWHFSKKQNRLPSGLYRP